MANEQNGTTAIIKKGAVAAEIVGQMEFTLTLGGTPIDISNKSAGDWIKLLDGAVAGQQVVLAGTIVYNDDTVYKAVRADAIAGTLDDYEVVYASGETFVGKFMPNGLSDALPHGDKISTSITLSSSDAVVHTPAP